MNSNQGFSLIETLIALFLISSTSLGLLNRQWQVSQLLNQFAANFKAQVEKDNQYEKALAE